jgi:hypothetical protein
MATNISSWTLLYVYSMFQNAKIYGTTYKIAPCPGPVRPYVYFAVWKVIERWQCSNYLFASCLESNSISQDMGSLLKVFENSSTSDSILASFNICHSNSLQRSWSHTSIWFSRQQRAHTGIGHKWAPITPTKPSVLGSCFPPKWRSCVCGVYMYCSLCD